MRRIMGLIFVLALMMLAEPCRAELPALIPREALLGNPDRMRPTISPDGKRLAWLAPDPKGILQVWVQTLGKQDAHTVTADRRRGIWIYGWAWDPNTILFGQDSDGDENWHTFAVDLTSGNIRDLTPWQGVRNEFVAANPKFPDEILVAMNVRDRKRMDVYRVNISGAVKLDTPNPGDVNSWLADDNLVIRGASAGTPQGGTEVRVRDNTGSPWRVVIKTDRVNEAGALDFSKDGKSIFLISSVGADTNRVINHDLSTGAETVLAQRDDSDVDETVVHPTRHTVQAAASHPTESGASSRSFGSG